MVEAIARAYRWREMLENGQGSCQGDAMPGRRARDAATRRPPAV
jgi:hypothetical protein